MALDPVQREAIINALTQDVEKLLQEGGVTGAEASRLRQDMRDCNTIYRELSEKAAREGKTAHLLLAQFRRKHDD